MNILYLTSEYKDESLGKDDPFVFISNSFCRKWVKQGHKVVVIHNASCFPKIIYYIPSKIKKIFEKKFGYCWGSYKSVCEKKYIDNGVDVYRLSIKKYIPHRSPSKKVLKNASDTIVAILRKQNFIPNVIIGQWGSPQAEIISRLSRVYSCPTSVVFHGTYIDKKNTDYLSDLATINKIGARSNSQAEIIQKKLNLDMKPFVCYSGLPDEYIKQYHLNLEKYTHIIKWKFVFVGRLVEYKKADIIIKALSRIDNINWELNIIGDGAQLNELKKIAIANNCEKKVIFHGNIPRDKVLEILNGCHCFIMASVNEVFGLVYLEAMGASCITVASKKGGIDGVIINEQNGFLIDEGSEEQLYELIKDITVVDPETLKKIASKAYETALSFSEDKVAIDYLNKVL